MSQNLCVFEYSNLGKAYLKITCNSKEIFLHMEDSANTDLLVDKIKTEIKNMFLEETPEQIYFIPEKPISHFKVNRKVLRRDYNISTK